VLSWAQGRERTRWSRKGEGGWKVVARQSHGEELAGARGNGSAAGETPRAGMEKKEGRTGVLTRGSDGVGAA
jgi:hypothetical protein